MSTITFSFIFNFIIGFLIGSGITFVLWCILALLKYNWRTPMNGFQDWLKLNDHLYIKDVLLIENNYGGVDEIWHNDIWFTNEGHSLTTKQLYKEYLTHALFDKAFQKYFY